MTWSSLLLARPSIACAHTWRASCCWRPTSTARISRLSMDLWAALVIPAAQRALRRLAGTPDTHVAFISGRTVADLAPRVRVGSASYHGDHGAERAEAGRGFRPERLAIEHEPVPPATSAMAERLKAEVPRRVDQGWLVVEDKGPARDLPLPARTRHRRGQGTGACGHRCGRSRGPSRPARRPAGVGAPAARRHRPRAGPWRDSSSGTSRTRW